MLSRVAENIYWLSRYLERAANTVRLVNVHSYMLLDLPALDEHRSWMPLIVINGQSEPFSEMHGQASEQSVNHFLLSDIDNHGSLINGFHAISGNLRSCRDIVPKGCYESINSLCREFIAQAADSVTPTSQRHKFLDRVENQLLAISASINNNMSHDLAYRFMRIGCYLERADMTSRIIDVQSIPLADSDTRRQGTPIQQQRWIAVLRSLSAVQMYRQHVHRPITGPDALDFLLHNDELPRSYRFCLNHLDECLQYLSNNDVARKAVEQLVHRLDTADLEDLSSTPVRLHKFLDELQLGMMAVGTAIAETYFPPRKAD